MLHHSGKSILIVDDEPLNLSLMKETLAPMGYRLLFGKSGFECLEIAQNQKPNLILLDIMMPAMDGFEVCSQLKANPETSKIPVLFVTTRTSLQDEERGFRVGAVDYITKPIQGPVVLARVKTHLSLVSMEENTKLAKSAVYMLAGAGHFHDEDTGYHIWRMAEYACVLAQAAGWAEDRVAVLKYAAPLHDTGKVGIPDSILKAPRKLNDDEWDVMRKHCRYGHEILCKSQHPVFKLAAEIALAHHEKWDGTGYPLGLKGLSIPESARIVAIADVFDALTMTRPYKKAWHVDKAFDTLLENAGSHFDPNLLGLFLNIRTNILEIKCKIEETRPTELMVTD